MRILKNVKKIAVGISGGVDSAVSAYLLKKKGLEVVGVFMKNWDLVEEIGHCTSQADLEDAKKVCDRLCVPLKEVNFVKEYWNEVFTDLLDDYKNGLTPNPDILCNKNIKFNHFLKFALEELGADAIATGHYARNSLDSDNLEPSAKLLTAKDQRKDQTFFLSSISQWALQRTVFPLGDFMKSSVKKVAIENGLSVVANKKESMGICFIGSRNFQKFISDYLPSSTGRFIDIDTGRVIGSHTGKHHWTIGQGCRIGGCKDKYYVAKKTETEDIYVALGHNHPVFFCKYLTTSIPSWVCDEPQQLKSTGFLRCKFRFQHGKPLVGCSVLKLKNGGLKVVLDSTLRALTPGQYSVFYLGDECLGCARIRYPGPSEYVINGRIVSS